MYFHELVLSSKLLKPGKKPYNMQSKLFNKLFRYCTLISDNMHKDKVN